MESMTETSQLNPKRCSKTDCTNAQKVHQTKYSPRILFKGYEVNVLKSGYAKLRFFAWKTIAFSRI